MSDEGENQVRFFKGKPSDYTKIEGVPAEQHLECFGLVSVLEIGSHTENLLNSVNHTLKERARGLGANFVFGVEYDHNSFCNA